MLEVRVPAAEVRTAELTAVEPLVTGNVGDRWR